MILYNISQWQETDTATTTMSPWSGQASRCCL